MANGMTTRLLRLLAVLWIAASAPSAFARGGPVQDVEERFESVRALIDRGQLTDAEAQADRLFQLVSDQPGAPSFVPAGNLLVEALTRNGHGAEPRTRQLADRIVGSRSEQRRADSPFATSLRNLGDVLVQVGEYQQASTRFNEALAIREQIPGVDPADVAEDLDHLARTLIEVERYDEALAASNRALALRERSRNASNAALARTLRIRGLARQRKAEYPAARADLERALALCEAVAPSHPDTVLALTTFGEQLSIDGDLLRAREVLRRAVALATGVLRPAHPDIASTLRSLAATLQGLGDIAGSRELRQRALEIAEKAFGPDNVLVAVQRNDLANTLLLQGDYAAARGLYERARETYRLRFGPDHLGVTTASYNLALLYFNLGDLQDARREFQRVIDTWERTLGRENPNVARALTALAETLARQGLYGEARNYFERALAIREKAYGRDHPLVASTLSSLLGTLARLGEVRVALELSSRAIGILEMTDSRKSLAETLVNRAAVLVDAGDRLAAAEAYERALAIRTALLGSSHPQIAETEVALATVLAHLQNRQEAFTRALRGEEIARVHSRLTLAFLSERQALEYASSRPKGLELALSLMSDAQEHRDVLNALILGRSLTLDEMGSRRRLFVNQNSGKDAPLWTGLASARQRLANLVIRGPSDQRPDQYATLVEEARREKERAERALAERSAAFRSEQARTEIGLEQVRAALPSSAALIAFARFDQTVPGAAAAIPSYVAFVLRPARADPEVVALGSADAIDTLIAAWRLSVRSAGSERAYRVAGANLRRRIWDPIAAHLDGVGRVFIVPDDAINLVSFAAMPVGQSSYLLQDGPVIHYLSAERDLAAPEQPSGNAGRGLLALGAPAFADASLFGKTQTVTSQVAAGASAVLRGAATQCGTFQSMQFRRLPGSGTEAQEVADLWRSLQMADTDSGAAVLGRAASEGAVKQLGPGRRILHLATHGFFLGDECASAPDGTRAVGGLALSGGRTTAKPGRQQARSQQLPENPLLLSGLVLAGANRRALAGPDEDDGILTAEEVASLNLEGVEWAVLSACDTGLGQLRSGEGVLGLRRAFQIAGARTIIMSLWPVEDRSARLWMRALYEGRLKRHLDTADSVREAALTVLRDRRTQGQSTHPFYWAGFVAAGDWR
jgi:CHAT domain-containing protein